MSGVTVAQRTRSIDDGSAPAAANAWRHGGRAMSVSASSWLANRRSRMPVRSMIHSSDVSTNFARSSFVTTLAGTLTPRPVIPNREPAADRRLRLPAPDRAAHLLEQALEGQLLARPDDALEANVVDPGEERELAAVLLLDEHSDRAGLRQRLDHLHARHDRVAGKVPGAVFLGDDLARDDARAGLELEHLVEQQERVAVREDLLDLRLAEGRVHATPSSSRSRRLFRARCA